MYDCAAQILDRERKLHPHHLHAVAEPLQVLVELPDVQVLLRRIPVRAQAFVHVRAAQDSQGEDAELRVLGVDDLAVQPDLEVCVTGHHVLPGKSERITSPARDESSSVIRSWGTGALWCRRQRATAGFRLERRVSPS